MNPVPPLFQPVYPATIKRLVQAVFLIVVLVLLGWALHLEPLKRLAPGLTSMNPLTAVAFIFAATALWRLRHGPPAGHARWLVAACGLLVLLIGLTRLSDVFLGTALCPDEVLFRSQLADGQAYPSRIAPNAALCFSLLGLALLASDRPRWPRLLHPQLLLLPVLVLAWIAIVGYAYNSSGFYQFRQFIPMALHTAACFILLAIALMLSRPGQSFMRWIPRGSTGARSFRRLLPACVLVPLLLGLGQIAGAGAVGVGPQFGASLASVATTLVMTLFAYLTALSLNRMDAKRASADAELEARRRQEERAHQWALALGELEDLVRKSRDDLPGGAAGVLGMVVGRAGAMQGALYHAVADPAGKPRLRTLALYAYDRPEQPAASYALGQGLVGQCAESRRSLHISAVPAGYFRLRSAGVDVLPGHLLLLPLLFDEELLGVLELACVRAVDAETERFLQAAARVLAFGLYRYDRTQRLEAELAALRARLPRSA